MHACAGLYDGLVTATRSDGPVIKSRAMSQSTRRLAVAMSVLIAVLLAVRLASVANAQPPVRASSGELMRATAISAPSAGVSDLNRQQPGGNRQDVLEKRSEERRVGIR